MKLSLAVILSFLNKSILDRSHRAHSRNVAREEVDRLAFNRSNDSQSLYYSTYLEYFLDAAAIGSKDSGIVIDRRFSVSGQEGLQEPIKRKWGT